MRNQLSHLLQNYFEGKLNLHDLKLLSELLADEKNSEATRILSEDMNRHFENTPSHQYNLKPVLDQIHHRINLKDHNKQMRLNWMNTFQRIAAILIFPLLFSFLAYFYFLADKNPVNESYAEIQCPMGVRAKFQLPDGSTGYLNSGAHLKYPVLFTKNRQVELDGEAYFDVVHNEKIPFHVNTRHMNIKVLGTTFNVIANDDEQTEEIILQIGKVDVSCRNGEHMTIMCPNDHLTLNTENHTFTKNEVEASQYTSWKDGKLVFRNENMQQVVRRLSRWYNADIVLEDNKLDKYNFHATFIDEQLDEVLKLLAFTTPISYSEQKRSADNEGIYQKRKLFLKIDQSKINQFK